jgi:hypothetical protein
LDTIDSDDILAENVTVTWQSSDCPSGRLYTRSASNSIQTRGASISFAIVDTCLNKTGVPNFYSSAPDVAIMETVTFQAIVILPQGTSENAIVAVRLPTTPGQMVLVSSEVVFIGSQINGSAISVGANGTVSGSNNDLVVFDFGTIVNIADGKNDTNDTLVIELTAYPNGTSLTKGNNLTTIMMYNDTNRAYNSSILVDIVEPVLLMTMTADKTTIEAGDVITYTLTIYHNSTSSSAALLLSLQKELVSTLQLHNGSAQASDALVLIAYSSNGIDITLGELPLGTNLTITYQATVLPTIEPDSSLKDSAVLTWQSSNCEPGRYYSTNASNTINTWGFNYTFAIVDTCVNETGNFYTPALDVTIMENIVFQSVITFPQGSTYNAVLTVQLPTSPGSLNVVDTSVVYLGSSLKNSSLSQNDNATTIDTSSGLVEFNFGNIVNVPDGAQNKSDQIYVQVTVYPADVSGLHQSKKTLVSELILH